eukprot:m.75623 g.75623  ORF g.75623 m.75623 type:complete len:60 (+) comp10423_c0_seq4:3009-3188(+)
MVCPFGFVAAAVFFAPQAVARVRELPGYQQAVVGSCVVLGGGYLVNQLMFFFLLPPSEI